MTSKKARSPLASNIVRLRNAKKWSQADLAHRVGVHVNTVKNIETDLNEGNFETRMAIAGALDAELADLYRDPATISQPQFDSAWVLESARVLNALAAAPPHRRLAALYLLTKDEAYLEQLRNLPSGSQFAQVLKKVL